jgi:ankyrin repeat protein
MLSARGTGQHSTQHPSAITLRSSACYSIEGLVWEVHFKFASSCGHVEVVKLLLERGAAAVEPKSAKDGQTALHLASCAGYSEVLRVLLTHHNVQGSSNLDLSSGHYQGIVRAGLRGASLEVLRLLFEHGADVNARAGDDDRTPLHTASEQDGDREDIARRLIDRGADVHAVDRIGRTLLRFASR